MTSVWPWKHGMAGFSDSLKRRYIRGLHIFSAEKNFRNDSKKYVLENYTKLVYNISNIKIRGDGCHAYLC